MAKKKFDHETLKKFLLSQGFAKFGDICDNNERFVKINTNCYLGDTIEVFETDFWTVNYRKVYLKDSKIEKSYSYRYEDCKLVRGYDEEGYGYYKLYLGDYKYINRFHD